MKQLLLYAATLCLWIVAILLCVCHGSSWLLLSLLAMHFTELVLIGIPMGRKYGRSITTCIVMCMLFGLFWWVPIKRIMAADDLKDSDFVEDGQEPWREVFAK